MAKVVTDLANRTPGKEAVAMESFAKALRMVRLLLFLFAACLRSPLISFLQACREVSHLGEAQVLQLFILFCFLAADHHCRQRRLRQRRPGGSAESCTPREQDHMWTE